MAEFKLSIAGILLGQTRVSDLRIDRTSVVFSGTEKVEETRAAQDNKRAQKKNKEKRDRDGLKALDQIQFIGLTEALPLIPELAGSRTVDTFLGSAREIFERGLLGEADQPNLAVAVAQIAGKAERKKDFERASALFRKMTAVILEGFSAQELEGIARTLQKRIHRVTSKVTIICEHTEKNSKRPARHRFSLAKAETAPGQGSGE